MKQEKIKSKLNLYRQFETDVFCDRLLFLERWLKMRTFIWKHKNKRQFLKFEKIAQFLYDLYVEKVKKVWRKKRLRYRIDIVEKPIKRNFRNWVKLSFKRVKLYYLYLSLSHFKKFDKEARRKSNYILNHLIMLLEFRVCVFLYKLSIINNIYDSYRFITRKLLLVNDKLITNVNERVWVHTLIRFRNQKIARKFRLYFIKKLKQKRVFFGMPKFIYFNMKFMYYYIWKHAELKDISYPTTQLDHIRRYIKTKDPVRVSGYGGGPLGFSIDSPFRTSWQPNIGVDIRRLMENQGK